MSLIFSDNFRDNLIKIHKFIATDSKDRADTFVSCLLEKIAQIDNMPLSYRKNPQLNREDVRDVIYKGYVVPFMIKGENYYVLDIYKNNQWGGI